MYVTKKPGAKEIAKHGSGHIARFYNKLLEILHLQNKAGQSVDKGKDKRGGHDKNNGGN